MRTWRLLLPLLFGMLVVVAFQAYCQGRANGHVQPGLRAFLIRYWQVRPWPPGSFNGWEHGITWNHLWYLAYLWPYTLLVVLAAPVLRLIARRLQAPTRSRLTSTLLLTLPVTWLLAVRLWLEPRYPESHALFGDWTVHAESLPLLLIGYLVATSAWFWCCVERLRWRTLLIAALAISIELSLRWIGRHPLTERLPEWVLQVSGYTVERTARAIYTWMALLAIFGWARVWLDRPFRWLPYCTEAVFPWYVLHQTLIIVLAYWLIPQHLGPVLEPALVIGGTVAGCRLLHEYLIRRTPWLRPLFGLRPGRTADDTAGP